MSLRKAINAYCKECSYDSLEPGTWLQQVTLCNTQNCPLWNVRPKTSSAIPISVLTYYQANLPLSQVKERE